MRRFLFLSMCLCALCVCYASIEYIYRHITAAKVHCLAVILHAEVDAVADDGAARVSRNGFAVAWDVEARPERD